MLRLALAKSAARVAYARPAVTTLRLAPQLCRYQSSSSSSGGDPFQQSNVFKSDWDAKEIKYEELKLKALQPTPDKYLIDVREPDEVLQGSIPSSVNLPLTVLPTALGMPPVEFKEKFGFEKPRKDQEVTFYCRSGKRSTTASDVAKRNGYTSVLNYKGSWLDWVEREGKGKSA